MRERQRRNRGEGNGKTQFAATPIDLTNPEDQRYAHAILPISRNQSKTSWDWYDKIGEIHYAVGRSARIAGYANLRVHKLEKDGSIGEPVTSGLAGELGDMLYSPYGGQRGLMERFITLMKVPADSYMIQVPDGSGGFDGIDFLSADEIKTSDITGLRSGMEIDRITLPGQTGDSAFTERLAKADFLGRVWRPSSRYVDMADSPLRTLDVTCELLYLLTLGIRSTLMSRLLSNGVFYVPSEVNEARSTAPNGEPNEFHQNNTLNELIKAAVYASRKPGEALAGLPVFMSGPGEQAANFKHIIMDQLLAETDMKLRVELIDRILTGLDIQKSQAKGNEDASHWTSWSASDDEIKVAIKPDIEIGCWAITRLFLWKKMQEQNRKPGEIVKHVVWYDLDDATSHTNIAEDARQLRDRILVGPKAARRMNGVPEKDAPTAIEYIQGLGLKMNDPYLATFGMSEAEKFDWDKIGSKTSGPSADSPAAPSKAGPGNGNPGSPADNKSDTPKRLRPA